MKDPSGDEFDKMVARTRTDILTENTTNATRLPNDFEPNNFNVLSMARMIP